jgi:predicted dehydrogenase
MKGTAARPRLALIGISGYGQIHLQLARGCRDRGEADLVAAVVINPAEEAANVAELRAKGCAIFDGYEDMLARHGGGIDVCLIPTGIHWHARMTLAALQAGANVLVEKPLAGSVGEVAAVQAAERAAGRFVAVGFQDCYDPGTQWLDAELRRGVIGAIRSVRFLGVWPRPKAYYLRNNWAGRLAADGVPVYDSPLNNALGHFVMLCLLFAGAEPAEIALGPDDVELFRAHRIESFDTGVVRLRTAQGVNVWLGASHASHTPVEPEIVVEGSAGRAGWSYEREAWYQPDGGKRQQQPVLNQQDTRRLMMAAVLGRLRDPAMKICTTTMAARHTTLIERLHAAAPVVSFPSELVTWSTAPDANAALPTVAGLDAALRRAFAELRPLRECGFTVATSAAISSRP